MDCSVGAERHASIAVVTSVLLVVAAVVVPAAGTVRPRMGGASSSSLARSMETCSAFSRAPGLPFGESCLGALVRCRPPIGVWLRGGCLDAVP